MTRENPYKSPEAESEQVPRRFQEPSIKFAWFVTYLVWAGVFGIFAAILVGISVPGRIAGTCAEFLLHAGVKLAGYAWLIAVVFRVGRMIRFRQFIVDDDHVAFATLAFGLVYLWVFSYRGSSGYVFRTFESIWF